MIKIRIFGKTEEPNEKTIEMMKAVCSQKSGVDLPTHTTGTAHGLKKTAGSTRPIFVRFMHRYSHKLDRHFIILGVSTSIT